MNKNVRIGILVGAVSIAVVATFVFIQRDENKDESADVPRHEQYDKAPDFELKNIDNTSVASSDAVGKIRVINMWATWCPFCVNELPDFVRLQNEFQDTIEVIAINRAEPDQKAKNYIIRNELQNALVFVQDPNDSYYKSIGGFAMPETLFIDDDGNIRLHKRGPITFEEMKTEVEKLLTDNNQL